MTHGASQSISSHGIARSLIEQFQNFKNTLPNTNAAPGGIGATSSALAPALSVSSTRVESTRNEQRKYEFDFQTMRDKFQVSLRCAIFNGLGPYLDKLTIESPRGLDDSQLKDVMRVAAYAAYTKHCGVTVMFMNEKLRELEAMNITSFTAYPIAGSKKPIVRY